MRGWLLKRLLPLRSKSQFRIFKSPDWLRSGICPKLHFYAGLSLLAITVPSTTHTTCEKPAGYHSNSLNLADCHSLPYYFSKEGLPQLLTDVYSDVRIQIEAVIRQCDSQGGKAVLLLTAANAAVYLLWKTAPSSFMYRHFASSLSSMAEGRVWTCITSNFSHKGIFHLMANMYLLHVYGRDVADVLGTERFYLYYGTAGIASTLASLSFRRLTGNHYFSLGASGAVAATLWLYACVFPERRMRILGLENTISIQELAIAFTVLDAAGLLGSARRIDFAAHLGGALFGNVWFYMVRDELVRDDLRRQDADRRIRFPRLIPWRTSGGNAD